jgi:2-dehydro-3-deoxyphosphogluconate aldolase / (4S)-4-hydroxy-2-oxoglutarate aldolase
MTSSVIAVLRAPHGDNYGDVVETLNDNGIDRIELTLSTPGTLESISAVRARVGRKAEIGVGTITTVEQAGEALAAGADFMVTPTADLDIVSMAVESGVPIYPGGLTPTELWSGWNAGATAVKLFPASPVGPEYIAHLRGPFPDIAVVPSGGVGIDDAATWIAAGACAVSVGGPLIGDAFRGGDLAELAGRCRRLVKLVAGAEALR